MRRSRGFFVIYRAYITTRSGRRIYARSYGMKAFKIHIPIQRRRR
jgi:hypothetical protein